MRITIIGTGYVGLVTGACLSDFGFDLTCCDIDQAKIHNLQNGIISIYEPRLKDFIERNVYYKRLKFTTDFKLAVKNSEILFIAVGTPMIEGGTADLSQVFMAAETIGKFLDGYRVVVVKSTVPTGTCRKVKSVILKELEGRGLDHEFDVVSNPEFLREGSAIYDFMHPDRIVVGTESQKALRLMSEIYRVLHLNQVPFVVANLETAETIKYASNSFLATKITFINEVANLCEKVGADVRQVVEAMGLDRRIGPQFLNPGPGYGGSCLPKDIAAFINLGKSVDTRLRLLETVEEVNLCQRLKMVDKIDNALGGIKNRTVAVLGLSFKPDTDDTRESPSLSIIEELVKRGAKIQAYDPEAVDEAKRKLHHIENIVFPEDVYMAIEGADAVAIVTEWKQFSSLDLPRIKNLMKAPYFFDLRNIYDRESVEKVGLKYYGVGR